MNPFRFTAREFDAETGLSYYRARYYDPTTGRFLSEDPIEFHAGIDFYRYVGNNPTTLDDPSGLQDEQPPLPRDSTPNYWDPGPPPAPRPPSPPPGWDNKGNTGGTLGPKPLPTPPSGPGSCPVNSVTCTYSGEFKDPSVDPKWKMCSYSCSDGTARVWIVHILLPCPPTPDRLPQ